MGHQLTIRYDDQLSQEIDELARREGISRNQAVVRLLRKGAEIEGPRPENTIGEALDWFIGSWSDEQAREFEEVIADFERIDDDMWE